MFQLEAFLSFSLSLFRLYILYILYNIHVLTFTLNNTFVFAVFANMEITFVLAYLAYIYGKSLPPTL